MQAFGPYKYKETVDFTQLKDNRLFVISGNTGAGKTTIFDGIAFALYGHASGEDRKEHKSMRSDFADDTTYTCVELIFETRGKKYRVLRQLAHIKKGRKTASGEKYEFVEMLPDGQEILACEKQKSKDISQKIEEIIGLTYDQFNQIVMLPQGEFRKLLTSSTENKELILRKIFKTERYSKIADRLEHKKKTAEKQRDEAKSMRDLYLDQITGALPVRESELFERLAGEANIYQIVESLQAEKTYYETKQVEDIATYELAQVTYTSKQQEVAMIQQRNDRLLKLQQKQQQLVNMEQQQQRYEAMKQEAEQANIALQIATIFETFETVTRELQQQQVAYANVQQQYDTAEMTLKAATTELQLQQQTENERKQLEQTIHELQKVEPLFATVAQLEQDVHASEIKLQKTTTELVSYDKQIALKTEQIIQLVATEEQLQQQLQHLPEKVVQHQTCKQILTAITQFEQAQQKVDAAVQIVEVNRQQLETTQATYATFEKAWVSNRAQELAAHLVDGEPCPVCGSKVHELHHLQQPNEGVTKEGMHAQKQQLELVSREFYGAEATLTAAKEQQQQLLAHLKEQQVNVNDKLSYEGEFAQLGEQIQLLQQQQAILQQTTDTRKAEMENLQRLQKQQQQLLDAKQQLQLLIETKKVELVSKRQQIPSDYPDHKALKQAIVEKTARLQQLTHAFMIAQQVFDEARLKATQLQEAVHQTKLHVEKLQTKQAQQQEQWQLALQQSPFETEALFKAAIRSRQQIEQLQQSYTTYMQQLFALQQFVKQEGEQLQDVEFVEIAQLNEQLQLLKQQSEQAFNVLSQTKNNIQVCEQYEKNLNKVAQKIIELEEIANNILNLYNVLRGQNTKRISFERYVQIGFLEQITAAANARLHTLSNGQYKLVSSERQLSHGRQSGLSLDVHDSYTDQVRDVKTLSGGEKFNASLCLALGMADVIQSFEGNVRIDTMFIDEGFGSLDEESLTRAIDTLIDLQKSGRIIGVISHVAELKAAIPAVLEVIKLKDGYSRTKITIK